MFPDVCVEFWKLRREVCAALRQTDNVFESAPIADALDPDQVPSLALRRTRDGVLAELDQDGFAFAVDLADAPLFNRRDRKLPRSKHQLDIVVYGGRVCIRKRFLPWPSTHSLNRKLLYAIGLPFYREAAALLRLRTLPMVPQIRGIDIPSMTIYRDYIDGDSLRHHIGNQGAIIHDLDLENSEQTSRLTVSELEEREIQLFSQMCGEGLVSRICENVQEINRRGVALLDVKLGNIVVGNKSGCPYWIDLEITQLSGLPRWEKSLRNQNLRIVRWFGRSAGERSGPEFIPQ
jgi:hypothetical protein